MRLALSDFTIGQRWISNTEAALGLGIVTQVADRRVTISFPAAGEERVYAVSNAPLNRISYKPGDSVKNVDGEGFTVAEVLAHNSLLIYRVVGDDDHEDILPELELDCFVHFNSPQDRLLSGQIDPLKFFSLRQDTLSYLRDYQQSGAQGLLGPRVQLLPHQLYIADQVASRMAPRVLLADEVGLGKTIEAGLIVHQQLISGRAERVLVLVPDSLVHQWLVEMLRRFNLAFSVLDENICQELVHEQANPFDTRQLVLCPLSFLVEHPQRGEEALACDWDLLVVDEAHHLEWEDGNPSDEYRCVEALAQKAAGVLLLTATPEQLGLAGHFARLRLLDPDRYYDLNTFIEEQQSYGDVNELANALIQAREQNLALPDTIHSYLGDEEMADIDIMHESGDIEAACDQALTALLDRHGTGRVLFRNTRAAVEGFPQRHLQAHPLTLDEDYKVKAPVADWLQVQTIIGRHWLIEDERVDWLTDLLDSLEGEKVLLITSQATTAIELEEYLRTRRGVRTAVFHEGMSLIQRDRAAAYFADPEENAQLLICSEIGSEGRNFQFAHHIVMFDLPVNPDLLEQRIGRLDRIGQQRDIEIHVPYYTDTPQQTLLSWYHQGLNAFEKTCAFGRSVYEEFADELAEVLESGIEADVTALITQTAERAGELRSALQAGRDRLLELNSCRTDDAEAIIDMVLQAENRKDLGDFVERACDQLGIESEQHSANTIIMRPSENMRCGLLPGMKDDGATYTYSRENALGREDMAYLTWEHPTVNAAMEHIVGSEHGNTALGTIKIKPLKEGTLLLEAIYTVNAIAPKRLGLDRFLPVTRHRVLVNLDGKDLSGVLSEDKLNPLVNRVNLQQAQALVKQAHSLIETLVANAESLAMTKLPEIKQEALQGMQAQQMLEIHRMKALAEVNTHIRSEEISELETQTDALAAAIEHADMKLDAVRVIMAV
ncbi:RNA polymerase-associated protein RapA [BD1-7 clade bacterium]|uniref:RNA polymerase-associated protein RapA n=1 Tax=BD1-7 clade bacterium TaxID=2029982 RepID=A0A5S9MNS8_9GAMM|nr:RNA polymerase-associated protein RapA [BD1-7 clade bacterium]